MNQLNSIPKIIWQTYRDEHLPSRGAEAVQSWKKMNPEWEYRFCTDPEILEFMNREFGGDLARIFASVPVGVMKADIWRYAILYKFGGLYADIDTTCLSPISWWELSWETLLVALENQVNFCQWTFAAMPQHPVLEKVLQLIVERGRGGIDPSYDHFVHWYTGPSVWTAAIAGVLGVAETRAETIYAKYRRSAESHGIQMVPARTFNGVLVSHAFGSVNYSAKEYVRWVDQSDDTKARARRLMGHASNPEKAKPEEKEVVLPSVQKLIASIPPVSPAFHGKGIVIAVDGLREFAGAWVTINMLRSLGTKLPIQIWYSTKEKTDECIRELVSPLGVECIDASGVARHTSQRSLNPSSLEAFATLRCPFQQVLVLRAGVVPVVNPEFLFDSEEFEASGALVWPHREQIPAENAVWSLFNIRSMEGQAFDAGQKLFHKEECWRPLNLALALTEHWSAVQSHLDASHAHYLAFVAMGQAYTMLNRPPELLESALCQHDFSGRRIFQFRCDERWDLLGGTKKIAGFLFEEECRHHLKDLQRLLYWRWGRRGQPSYDSARLEEVSWRITGGVFDYHRIGVDHRMMTFLPGGIIGKGATPFEVFWEAKEVENAVVLEISSPHGVACVLTEEKDGHWTERWIRPDQASVELRPLHFGESRGEGSRKG
jgi:hypothetical protein